MPGYANPIRVYRFVVRDSVGKKSYRVSWIEYEPESAATFDDPGFGSSVDYGKVELQDAMGNTISGDILPRTNKEWAPEHRRIAALVESAIRKHFED